LADSLAKSEFNLNQPDLPDARNGRDGETINRGQTATKAVIVAMRNDGMNSQFRNRCYEFDFEESRVANHFNKTRNAN
jgi:hypothetical protein